VTTRTVTSDSPHLPGVVYLLLPSLLLVLTIGVLWLHSQTVRPEDRPLSLPPPPVVDLDLIVTVLPQDAIRAIDDPQFELAARATEIDPDERVIGVVIHGEARAYPLPILSSHEIVNDVIGGEPVAITWCPLCYSALVFSRRIEGRAEPLTFGVSGKLLYNTLVMYDRETGSLWSQLYGAAIDGPLSGKTLRLFPSLLTEWAAWRAEHPDTQVLSKRLTRIQFDRGTYAESPRGSYDVDPYASYYNMPDEGLVDHQIPRDAFERRRKERVLGMRIGDRARAYPFRVLASHPVVNDQLGDVPVLVWFDAETQTGVAFERRVAGRVLTFQADPVAHGFLVDVETGTHWRALTGTAVSGPLQGERLRWLPATPAFAFGWYDHYPDSETYSP